MKIGIIGGGSIGLLFAHYLNKMYDVTIYTRSKEQAEMLMSKGLIFEKDNNSITERVNALTFSSWTGEEELTIIAVKQYHLLNVIRQMKEINQNHQHTLLFVQNGMGHLKWLNDFTESHIFVGTVEHGALKVSPNYIIHTGNGQTKIASFKGDLLDKIRKLFDSPIDHFPFVFEDDYHEMLLQKLIINAVINPLTAILAVPNGELLENPHFYRIFKELFIEISNVLNISNSDKAFAQLENVCRKTAANRSSMLKDVDEKRPTEVDAILGYVLEKGKEKAMNTPLTKSFYYLIKGKEYEKGGN
ncbi:2-dehydropantoate 2-reductase [Bacillus sp. Bva_UNVM-123]|uniref:2-dehydropantoate 2-reductase n=1 Tax=Bacillus sp. Bva_UNVM-123 TaxID=2829798 RepID=UPI00391FB3DD